MKFASEAIKSLARSSKSLMKSMRKIFHQKNQSPRNRRRKNRNRVGVGARVFLAILLFANPQQTRAQAKPDKDYLVYVLSEAADKISLIRFGPNGARIDHQFQTGDMPVDIDGPHGIAISPDKEL